MSLRGQHGPHFRPPRALRRLIAGVCGAALIVPGSALAASSPSSAPGAPCAGSGASAQNQYCENIPGAGGSQTPGSGSPTLGATLPAPARASLLTAAGVPARSPSPARSAASPNASRPHARAHKLAAVKGLLNLPAAPRWSLGSASPASASALAPVRWLIVLVAMLAVSAAIAARLRRRRLPTA